jgi:predicted DNA-binding transcriptional regulator AlpA
MKTYNFLLVLSSNNSADEELEDRLFEAGCDDATLSYRNETAYLEFDREAASFKEAILSAIKQVENTNIIVERIEPDDLVNASEIARRIKKSREYVRLLIEGKRGKTNFPKPVSGMSQKSLIWSWSKIADWLQKNEFIDYESVTIAQDIADINYALFYRYDLSRFEGIKKISQQLTTVGN